MISVLLLVLAGWSALSVAIGLLLCRGMRRPDHRPAPPGVLPWQASTPSSPGAHSDPAVETGPDRTAASA